jgi:hypothetical protein
MQISLDEGISLFQTFLETYLHHLHVLGPIARCITIQAIVKRAFPSRYF